MANTIRIGTFEVSSFKVGLKDPKIYLGDTLLYPTGGYKVCYAVVDDITQYTDREYEDVYDKATEKWFKLNNLNQYEQYGVYASGRTSCEGSSRLPQGYTEVEYVENTSTAYIDTGEYLNTSNFEVGYTFWGNSAQWGYVHQNVANGAWVTAASDYAYMGRFDSSYRVAISSYLTSDENTIVYTQSGVTVNGTSISKNLNLSGTDNLNASTLLFFAWYDFYGAGVQHSFNSKVKSFYLKNNGTLVRDFVPAKRDSDNKYGMYDIVNDTFYLSPNNVDFIGGEPITSPCVTTYNGKLTIDGDYEYQYSGGSWVNVGEVSGSTIDTIWFDPSATNALFNIGHYWGENYKMVITTYLSGSYSGDYSSFWQVNGHSPIELSFYSNGFYYDMHNPTSTTAPNVNTNDYDFRILNQNTFINYQNSQVIDITLTYGSFKAELADSGTLIYSDGSTKTGYSWYSGLYQANIGLNNANAKCHLSHIQIYNGNNELVNDFKFIKNNGVVGSQEISIYDSVTNTTYNNTNSNTPVYHIVSDSGGTEYPIYYDEKAEPLDNLTFNTLAEAQAYAEANCVYDGMHATIGTDRYYFDSTDENGWVKILEYYKFEDVTPGGASGWTISGSATYNPDSSYYDDFSVENSTTSYQTKIAKVTIYGYDSFTYYLRSTGRTSYAYVVSTNVDEIQTPPSTMSYDSSSAITNTYYWNKSPKSAVNLSNYRRVTYNNLDKTVEHTFYVYFYGRTYSSYVGNATILIPKEQTNENWEQVTFSASSNVASAQKNLYIDGNNSTSGGTQYWYYRWMIGLPSGSHTGYTNYSNYSYCPKVQTSTFTSVAGEQRQVNFTYDNTTEKRLSFRLVDNNGNVLSPSDTVYYNMTLYNSCNVSTSSSNLTFPYTYYTRVGGRFYFSNSSNRHYIYGYTAPATGTTYYVDNYSTTFDIVYTALTRESVTVTYTTYDPSDVETPAFKTDITWPYSGGTTSSTTLTSYSVPYTYPYKVSQTSNKFSADSQSYTANQAARTINFVLYPNNREFASVADLEAYAYAYEGMKASVNGTNYRYENGQWVEITSKDSDFVIGDFNTFVSSSTEVTEGYYIIYSYAYDSSYANKNYLFSWNSGNTWSGYYTLGNMNHSDSNTSVPISSSEIIDDAVWEFKDAGNGNFYIRNVATNKYWYYLGTNTNYGVPLTDNANDATPVSIQDWRSCLAFVEKQSGSNHPINKLYGYPYRYGWYANLATDGNNQYYMRKYVP